MQTKSFSFKQTVIEIDVSAKENLYFLFKKTWGLILNIDLSENLFDGEVGKGII